MDDQMFDKICYDENIIIHLPLHNLHNVCYMKLCWDFPLRLLFSSQFSWTSQQFFLWQHGRGINLSSSVNDENATFNLTSCEHVVFTKVTVNFSNERNRKSFTIWEKRQCYYFISQIVKEIDLHCSTLKKLKVFNPKKLGGIESQNFSLFHLNVCNFSLSMFCDF